MTFQRGSPAWIVIGGIMVTLILVGPPIIDMVGDMFSIFRTKP